MFSIDELLRCARCSCRVDIMVYAVPMVLVLLAILTLVKIHVLPACTSLEHLSAFSPMMRRGMDRVTQDQAQKILWFRALMERKNSRVRHLAEQTLSLERELTDLRCKTQAAKQEAARELDRKDKDMKNLARKCRKILDPGHPYDDDMDVGMVAILAEQRHSKWHESLKKREKALVEGELAKALKLEKKTSRNQAYAHRLEIQGKESRICELTENISQLLGENGDRELRIKALNDQLSSLNETKTKLERSNERSLTQMGEVLEREERKRVAIEKTVLRKDLELADAESKASSMTTQHRNTQVALTNASRSLVTAHRQNKVLEEDVHELEHRVANLRIKLEEVRKSNKLLEKEADKLRHPTQQRWNGVKVAASIKSQFELEFGAGEEKNPPSKITEATKSQIPCEHEAVLRAAVTKEAELAGHVERLESANKLLQTQSAAEKNAHQAILVQATALHDQMATELGIQNPDSIGLDQCFDEFRSRLSVAISIVQVRDTELHKIQEKYDASRTELQHLREKEEAGQLELRKLRDDAESSNRVLKAVKEGRANCVKEIKVKEDEILRLQKKARDADLGEAKQKRIADKANDQSSDLQKRLTEVEKNVKEQGSEIVKLEKALKARNEQFKEAREQWDELECTLRVEGGEKAAELHLSQYLLGQEYCLPEIEAVERDLARTRAISEEKSALEYDDETWSVLEDLAFCNDCMDSLRAALQQTEQPTQKELRNIIEDSRIEDEQLEKLKQDVPQLRLQVREANKLVVALLDILDIEAAETARAARFEAHEANGGANGETGEDEERDKADDDLCRALLERLDAPRGDGNPLEQPLVAEDANMA